MDNATKDTTDISTTPSIIESEVIDSVELASAEVKKPEESEVIQQNNEPVTETVTEPESMAIEEPEKVEESEKIVLVSEKASEEVQKVNEPEQVSVQENTDIAVDEPEHQNTLVEQPTPDIPVSDQLITTSDNLMESAVPIPVSDQLVTTSDNLMESAVPTPVSDQLSTTSDNLMESAVPTPVTEQLNTSDNLMESAVPTQENLIEPTQDQIVPVGQDNLMEGSQQQVIPVTESVSNNDVVKLDDNGVDLDQQSVLSMKDSELKDLVMRELSEFLTEEPSQNVGQPLLEIKSEFIKNDDQKKIENLENTLSETNKINLKEEKKSENDIADALSTLATAALNQAPPTNGNVDSVISKPIQPAVQVKQEGPAWCDVGVIKGTTCLVKQFYSTSLTDEHENTSLDHLPDYTNKLKIDIQPGTAYKLRIAAINACGRGEWSEISAFKTCLPGYPGAPSAIKITKAPDGASLTWEAPPTSSGKILEYSVCLAIKNPKEVTPQSPKPTSTNLNFVRVYCGPQNAAVVSHESLGAALIDRTNKPAIIFRIAAKNEKGYGPATQVRWLQDSNVPGSNKNPSMKREKSVNLLTGVPKRPKI